MNDLGARTAALLQEAAARGQPVMIPGAFEPRHWAPHTPRPRHAQAPVFDRARLEREWEGGGTPAARGRGRRPWALGAWLRRTVS